MTPEEARMWIRVIRDLLIVGAGVFVIIFEVVGRDMPNVYALTAGLIACGLPPVLRIDKWWTNGHETEQEAAPKKEDRWSHLP